LCEYGMRYGAGLAELVLMFRRNWIWGVCVTLASLLCHLMVSVYGWKVPLCYTETETEARHRQGKQHHTQTGTLIPQPHRPLCGVTCSLLQCTWASPSSLMPTELLPVDTVGQHEYHDCSMSAVFGCQCG